MYDFLNVCAPIYEISSESTISGRRPIKVVLHEIHPDDSVYQENGISWNEEYTKNNMHSVVGMSIVAEFLSEDRDVPYGHGMTDIRDNMPLFEDATMVGHFDKTYVDDVEIEGVTKRVLIAEGTLDEMRYPKFVSWLKERMEDTGVKGSVEIVGKPENDKHIIYSGGWKEKGRVPQIYDYSGYAILGIKPADAAAIVMELNNKNQAMDKEESVMDEKLRNELTALLSGAVAEMNSKWDEFYAQITAKDAEIAQLRADIEMKEAEVAQIQADMEAYRADMAAKEAGLSEANAQIDEMKKQQAIADLNAALENYTEEQREIAKEEIEAFNADPGSVEINSIIGKICTEMVRVSRETNVETNSAIDVFSVVEETLDQGGDEEVDVF